MIAAHPDARPVAELAIVIPAYNEARNVALLVDAIDHALPGVNWEAVYVDDDSPDGTAEVVRRIAQIDARVRVVQRVGRRGLSSACVEGMLATSSPIIAVMDADLQHDERILGAMLDHIRGGDIDLVVGSRYVEGGGTGDWGKHRVAMSKFATRIATRLTRTPISDPMSGFFMITRAAFMAALPNLSTVGFKILLDLAASSPKPLRIAEVPFVFRSRQHGESKMDALVLWEYAQLLLDKMFGHIVPPRFIGFALVGGSGVIVHFAVLTTLYRLAGFGFDRAQLAATLVATSSNFFLNNVLTYRDQRLKGRGLLIGWITFNLVCGIGALTNYGIAHWLFAHHSMWQVAALAGIAVTTVWNFAMSSTFTWKRS